MIRAGDGRSHLGALPDPVDCELPIDKLRVVLVDDSAAMLAVVSRILQSNFLVAGTYLDGESLLKQVSSDEPDVIVLDFSIGEISGLDVARQLTRLNANIKMIFLSVHEDLDFVAAALDAGATAYVFKSRLNQDLVPALHAVTSGRIFVSFNAAERPAESLPKQP